MQHAVRQLARQERVRLPDCFRRGVESLADLVRIERLAAAVALRYPGWHYRRHGDFSAGAVTASGHSTITARPRRQREAGVGEHSRRLIVFPAIYCEHGCVTELVAP